jgi:hypothetical protein
VLLTTISQIFNVPKMKKMSFLLANPFSKGLKMEFGKDGCEVNHGGKSTKGKKIIFSMLMFDKIFKLHFGTKDLTTSIWQP